MLGIKTTSDPGMTGVKDIADALGGGIRENSLLLIEGEPGTGKSVLCQHIVYGVLNSKESAVAYFSSEHNFDTLITQMDSLSMETRHELGTDRFRIQKMGSVGLMKENPKKLQLIIDHITALSQRFKLIIVDSPSQYFVRLAPLAKMDFLEACKEQCKDGRSIILSIDTHGFEGETLLRAYAISDYYLKLRSQDVLLNTGQIDTRVIKSLEVTKLAGAERRWQDLIKFEIKPNIGIQILPFVQIKV